MDKEQKEEAQRAAAECLEPRVKEWDGGYWVLKEKYRTELNPQEKVKLCKEPMMFFTEGGIKELAKLPMEEIDADKLTKEDVDLRLKWIGLFHHRKQQSMLTSKDFASDLKVDLLFSGIVGMREKSS